MVLDDSIYIPLSGTYISSEKADRLSYFITTHMILNSCTEHDIRVENLAHCSSDPFESEVLQGGSVTYAQVHDFVLDYYKINNINLLEGFISSDYLSEPHFSDDGKLLCREGDLHDRLRRRIVTEEEYTVLTEIANYIQKH